MLVPNITVQKTGLLIMCSLCEIIWTKVFLTLRENVKRLTFFKMARAGSWHRASAVATKSTINQNSWEW